MPLFKATMVTGGPDSKKLPIILNSASIIGVSNGRVLIARDILDMISMQEFNAANKISHIEVTPDVAQSLLDIK